MRTGKDAAVLLCEAIHLSALGLVSAPKRTMYLMLTIMLTVTAWLTLSAMSSPFVHKKSTTKSDYITVLNARRGQPMPRRYADRITKISGVNDLSYIDIQLLTCAGSGRTATINAIGGDGLRQVLSEEGVAEDVFNNWADDRLGVIVSESLASSCGWLKGTTVSPRDVKGQPVEIHISGTYPTQGGGGGAYGHYNYFNRISSLAGAEKVLQIYVRPSLGTRSADELASRIEDVFSHDDPPVEANPDTVQQASWARFGNVQYVLGFVMVAIFLCCALVFVSIMAHNITQRRGQLAVLKVLGFTNAALFFGLLIEALSMTVLPAAIGCSIFRILSGNIPDAINTIFGGFVAPGWSYLLLGCLLVLLVAVAALGPLIIILKIRPTEAGTV